MKRNQVIGVWAVETRVQMTASTDHSGNFFNKFYKTFWLVIFLLLPNSDITITIFISNDSENRVPSIWPRCFLEIGIQFPRQNVRRRCASKSTLITHVAHMLHKCKYSCSARGEPCWRSCCARVAHMLALLLHTGCHSYCTYVGTPIARIKTQMVITKAADKGIRSSLGFQIMKWAQKLILFVMLTHI